MHLGEDCGNHAHQNKSTYEQNSNIRNFIADTFDKTENAANLLFLLSSFHNLINSLNFFTQARIIASFRVYFKGMVKILQKKKALLQLAKP
jgi:hypothetical protein